jgi:hypothetical protein
MKVTTIIRIEHEDGWGMFRMGNNENKKTVDQISWRVYTKHGDMPGPRNDGLEIEADDFCAYTSMSSMSQWIQPEDVKLLIPHGYKVYLIDVTEAKIGEHQALFKKQNIVLKKDITVLFT